MTLLGLPVIGSISSTTAPGLSRGSCGDNLIDSSGAIKPGCSITTLGKFNSPPPAITPPIPPGSSGSGSTL